MISGVSPSGSPFIALLIPSCPGALFDLATNHYLAAIVNMFLREKSTYSYIHDGDIVAVHIPVLCFIEPGYEAVCVCQCSCVYTYL